MKITARVRKVNLGKTVGFADITIDEMFIVKDLKVIQGNSGLFVAMPNVKLNKPYTNKEGVTVEYQDTFFPITKEARELIQTTVLSEFGDEEYPF